MVSFLLLITLSLDFFFNFIFTLTVEANGADHSFT